ncbi:hypothetical protein B0G84_7949 [Paraburkholderia sp. BL8N3]|nr:hypothetical protein [Paraburkholderia sp. BL8N3]TCK33660.1 hypothetical protein B0G84_7949 [Paraburkholderia sp. BL8N3]
MNTIPQNEPGSDVADEQATTPDKPRETPAQETRENPATPGEQPGDAEI